MDQGHGAEMSAMLTRPEAGTSYERWTRTAAGMSPQETS